MKLKDIFGSEDQDYTNIPIRKAVLLLSIPMVVEMMMESIFAIVDIYFANHTLGNNAVQIIGLSESLIMVVYSIAMGLSMAGTASVARRIGEQKIEEARKTAAHCIMLSVLLAIPLGLIGIFFAGPLLRLLSASEQAIAEGKIFAQLLIGFNVVIFLLYVINGAFRGAGNVVLAMKSLILANIINIVLCPLLMKTMGIKGAALATIIGRSAGVLYQAFLLRQRKNLLFLSRADFRWQPEIAGSLIRVAFPGAWQFLISSGSWIFMASLVAHYGAAASAGYQTAIRLLIFFIMPAWGLSSSVATLVGQNLGAGKPERVTESVRVALLYNIIFMALVTIFFYTLGIHLSSFFTSDRVTIGYADDTLKVISSAYVFYGMGMVFLNAFNGAGATKAPTYINILGFWCIQIPLAYLMYYVWKVDFIWLVAAIPFAETLITILSYGYFRSGKWKEAKV